MRRVMSKKQTIHNRRYYCAFITTVFCLFISQISFAQDFIATSLGDYGNVTVMEVTGNYDATIADFQVSRQEIAKEFFKNHPDDYDFLVIFSNFTFNMPSYVISGENVTAAGFYCPVRNGVQGIGRELFDYSSFYGSNGKLQGTIDMGALGTNVSDPLDPGFQKTMSVLSHEILHRWAAYVKFKKTDGSVSDELLGSKDNAGTDRCHWSFLLDTAGSVLYGNRWQNNGNGTFTSLPARKYYGPLDLYLMGLVDKTEVSPMLLIENSDIDPERLPESGITVSGSERYITIDDIIAAEGERVPSAESSQKKFKIGCIFVVRPDTFKEADISGIRNIIDNWVIWFSGLTNGKGTLWIDSSTVENIPTNPGTESPVYDPRTAPPEINDGVTWLIGNQESDGSWQDSIQTVERDTAEVISALKTFPVAAQSHDAGVQWLDQNSSNNTDYLSRTIETLNRSGENVAPLVAALLSSRNADGGWGGSNGYISNMLDTSRAIKSLLAAGYTDKNIIAPAIEYLRINQNQDGGWGDGAESSTIQTTTDVLTAFNYCRSTYSLEGSIQKGISWLLGKQNPDNGFGNSPSTIYDTAAAAIILKELNVSPDTTASAVDYILSLQSEDGSWFESPYQTAMAVSAVWKGNVEPDLSITTNDISFTPSTVTSLPSQIIVNAEIKNSGYTDVSEVSVWLYEGTLSDADKRGEQTISIPGKASATATFTVTVTNGDAHRYYVVIDPQGLVTESSKTNNTAIKMLYPETSCDFDVQHFSVVPNPGNVLQPVVISSRIRNNGTSDAFNVPVKYYIESASGTHDIATVSLNIPAGTTVDHEYIWKADIWGDALTLCVFVDSADAFAELSETNNKMIISPFAVNEATAPNLTVSHNDIVITPIPAHEGGTATISSLVKNEGFTAVQNAEVRFYKEVPGNDGVLLGTRTIASLNQGETADVSIDWGTIADSGDKIITVVVDPENKISEVIEDDNSAFRTIRILSLPDLEVADTSIRFEPAAPKDGDTVSISTTVQNTGQQEVTAVAVRVYEGGSIIGSGTIPTIAGNSQAEISFAYETTGKTGAHEIMLVVDPDNSIVERNKDNNTASRTFAVQDADLWVTELYISPNGDGIKDETQFSFRLKTPQTVSVVVVNSEEERLRTFTAPELENTTGDVVTWNGFDDEGRVVPDGEYQLRIINASGAIISGLSVVVDNNRSSLIDAIESHFLLKSNLTCMLPDTSDERWFPDESGMVVYVYGQNSNTPEYPTGLYTVTPDGEDVMRLVPHEWCIGEDPTYDYRYPEYDIYSLSNDGETIAFVLEKYNRLTRSTELMQLWTVDRYGENLMMLDSREALHEAAYIKEIEWAPDSRRIAYRTINKTTNDNELWIVKSNGTDKQKMASVSGNLSLYTWSSDGQKIAFVQYDEGFNSAIASIVSLTGDRWDIYETTNRIATMEWLSGERVLIEEEFNSGRKQIRILDTSGSGNHISADVNNVRSLLISSDRRHYAVIDGMMDFVADPWSVKLCDENGNCTVLHESSSATVEQMEHPVVDELRWSRNGDKIAFVDYGYTEANPGNFNAYVVVIDLRTMEKKAFSIEDTPDNYFRYVYDSLQWFSDNVSLVANVEQTGVIAINTDSGEKMNLPIEGAYYGTEPRVSPIGRHVTYNRFVDSESICAGRGWNDLWAMRSLMNLTADLRVTKDSSAVILKGIAADLHLADYKLEYADAKNLDAWSLITPPSTLPVINDVMALWVPPYESTFYVRLTVSDRAGNRTWERKRVTWGQSVSVTNLYKSEELFSPNGDGVKDTVELHYRVVDPVHLEFYIHDADGMLVRTFLKDHSLPGEDYLTWDGRDESGAVVPDGIYTMKVFDYEFYVEVDTTPPRTTIEFGNIEGSDQIGATVSGADMPVYADLRGGVFDDHIKEWIVECGDGDNPQEWHEFKRGTGNVIQKNDDSEPIFDADGNPQAETLQKFQSVMIEYVVGKKFRITAVDHAGNKQTRLAEFLEEVLVANLWKIPKSSDTWYPIPFVRNKDGGFIPRDVILPEYVQPGQHHLRGLETLRLPLAAVTLQCRRDMQWIDALEQENPLSGVITVGWDNSDDALNDVDAVRIKAVDVTGIEHFSNPVYIRSLFFITVGCSEPPTARQNLFEDLTELKFQVMSNEDERYPEWTDYKVLYEVIGDIIPKGTFYLPLPSDLREGVSYSLRMTGVDADGGDHISNVVTYPPSDCAQLLLDITYDSGNDCGVLSSGKVEISARCIKPPSRLKTLSYYIKAPGRDRELLRCFDLAGEGWGSVFVDTSRMDEGTYTVEAVVEYVREDLIDRIGGASELFVDRMLPEALIRYPGDTEYLCPMSLEDSGGSWRGVNVEVKGSDDTAVKQYDLYYGIGEDPGKWMPAVTRINGENKRISGHGAITGTIGPWNVPDMAGTVFSLKFKVTDIVGNVNCYTTACRLDTTVPVAVSSDKKIFSPNGDGEWDDVTINYSIGEYAAVDVTVMKVLQGAQTYPVERRLIVHQPHIGGPAAIVWDGRDDAGAVVPDGLYQVMVAAIDSCNNEVTEKIEIEVDTTPPTVGISSPQPSDSLGVMVEVTGSVSDTNFAHYDLTAEQGETKQALASGNNPISNRIMGAWNTYGLAGQWTLKLAAVDKIGNTSEATVIVDLEDTQTLIKSFTALPVLFSPNNDGKRETTDIRYELEDTCDITIEIRNESAVKKTYTAQSVSTGEYIYQWNGSSDVPGETVVPDGAYTIMLKAVLSSNPTVVQEEIVTVVVDGVHPSVAIGPSDNVYLKGSVTVSGTITDQNLAHYSLSYTGDEGTTILDEGNQNREDHTFGVIGDLSEGTYVLTAAAEDCAENAVVKTSSFTVDRTPPRAVIQTPESDDLYGSRNDTVSITGTVDEENLEIFSLRYGSGDNPTQWIELFGGDSLTGSDVHVDWVVGENAGIPDGIHTVSLYAKDKAGWEGEARVKIIIDNTIPEVSILSLENGDYVKSPVSVVGTCLDENLDEYIVEISAGECGRAFKWVPIRTSSVSVVDSVLALWSGLPPDGKYCLRVSATDRVGNRAETAVGVIVDTQPPSAPVLSGKTEDNSSVVLDWSANSEPDIAGYNVYKNGTKVNITLIIDPHYKDQSLGEGTYKYSVRAVDQAGWESESSNEIEVTIDLVPPDAHIGLPRDGAIVSDIVDIKGTSYSEDDFKEYRVFIGEGSAPSTWILLRTSPVPVNYDTLVHWDSIGFAEGVYSIKLEAEDINGNVGSHQIAVTVDNTRPVAPILISATPSGSNVNITWQANTEADLAGYLLYRNHELANVSDPVIGNLKPYLLTDTHYTDSGLPDGTFSYYLLAMDEAGNISDQSNTIDVEIDTKPPQAFIVAPEDGVGFENNCMVKADSPDGDIIKVQFQYKKADESVWINLGSAVTTQPWITHLDPAGLGFVHGTYHLRAVATDRGEKTDESPSQISIIYTDVTAPASPADLRAGANEDTVTLTWSANTEEDLDGYNVYRLVGTLRTKLNMDIVKDASFVDPGLDVDTYGYEVTAVDTYGNESKPSTADATIYAPVIDQPYTPSGKPVIHINGAQAAAYSTVEIFTAVGAGDLESRWSVTADAQGMFDADIISSPGENRIAVQAIHGDDSRSKMSDVVVVVYNEPPAVPEGLTAAIDNKNVSLSWNPNSESDLAGYNLYRNGEKLNTSTAVTTGTATASLSGYAAYKAFDNNPSTIWYGSLYETKKFAWWQIDLVSPELISRLEIDWYSPNWAAKDYEIQMWSGYAWITWKKIVGNTEKINTFDIMPAYRTDKIRIFITGTVSTAAYRAISIAEIGIQKESPIAAVSYEETDLPDGMYEYQVSAVDYYGFESTQSEKLDVPVGDVVPPDPPQGLVASATGSDIELQWLPNSENDLAGYYIYRAVDQGWAKISSVPATETTYTDTNLRNGTHTYRITAFDTVGNESEPSNTSSTDVAVDAPPTPVNPGITIVPEGSALMICWESSGGTTVGYKLYRSLAPGGPYERINDELITDTCYTDTALTNGVTYYYVITAVDLLGNESAYSEHVASIPADTTAPVAPVLFQPTTSGTPLEVGEHTVDVGGWAEPAATVKLFGNGNSPGEAKALEENARQLFTIFDDDSYALDLSVSPDGTKLAYFTDEPSMFFGPGWLKDLSTGETTQIFQQGYSVSWSDDGKTLACTLESDDGFRIVRLYTPGTGAERQLTGDTDVNEFSPSWTHDGKKIAFISDRSGLSDVWIKDLETNSLSQVTQNTDAWSVSISPDGTNIAYAVGESLHILDINSGNSIEVTSSLYADIENVPFAWSPDSTKLAFVSFDDDSPDIYILDAGTTNTVQVTDSDEEKAWLAWSPDGGKIAFALFADNHEELKIVPAKQGVTPDILVQAEEYLGSVEWLPSGRIAYMDGVNLILLYPQGFFSFADVGLDAGENVFHAIAVDSSGNESSPSDDIVVILDNLPDLEIADDDIFVYPAAPLTGEVATISVTARNKGSAPAENVHVDIYHWDPSGAVNLVKSEVIPMMDAGSQTTISFACDPVEKKGEHIITAYIDDEAGMLELSEENNFAVGKFYVADSEGVNMITTLDADIYNGNEDVDIDIRLFNSGAKKDVVLAVSVEDESGFTVAEFDEIETELPYGANKRYSLIWNTGRTYAGMYRVRTVLKEASDVIDETVEPFTITSAVTVSSSIITDKVHYGPEEDVVMDVTVMNDGYNYDVSELTVRISVVDAGDQELFAEEKGIVNLRAGTKVSVRSIWNTQRCPTGEYRALARIIRNSESLSDSSESFDIDAAVELTGTVMVSPAVVLMDSPVGVDYSVTNAGNSSAHDLAVTVVVCDLDSLTVVAAHEELMTLGVNETKTGHTDFNTAGFEAKQWKVILRYGEDGDVKSLASASFTVKDGTAPVLTVVSPQNGESCYGSVTMTVIAGDNASGVEKVEYRIDGGNWIPLPATDAASGKYSSTWEPLESDEGEHQIRFRATDKEGNTSTPVNVTVNVILQTPFARLTGTLSASPDPVYQGLEEQFTYTVTNDSPASFDNMTVTVLIVEHQTQDVKATLSGTTSVPANTIATGGITHITADLVPGMYDAVLQVAVPDIPEAKILSQTTFEVVPSIAVAKTTGGSVNLLVWVNDACRLYTGGDDGHGCGECGGNHGQGNGQGGGCGHEGWVECVRVDLLENILNGVVDDYYIVFDPDSFEEELRNPWYTDILILGDHEPLRYKVRAELREKVFSGTGVISSLWLRHFIEPDEDDWWDISSIFGVRWSGHLWPGERQVETVASPVTNEGIIAVRGKAKRIEAKDGTTVAGWIEPAGGHHERSPAIVINTYGAGTTIYCAFDLGLSLAEETYDLIADLVTRSVGHVHKPGNSETYRPYDLIPVKIDTTSGTTAFNLRMTETYSEQLRLYDIGERQWNDENPWTKDFHLDSGETETARYGFLLPDIPGTYTSRTEVGFVLDSGYVPFRAMTDDFVVEKDIETLIDDVLAGLDSLSVSFFDRFKVWGAISFVHRVQDRVIRTDRDIEENIRDILRAIHLLLFVGSADPSDVRVMLDNILKIEQSRYFYFEGPEELLSGTISAAPNPFIAGEPATLTFTVTNAGEQALNDVIVRMLIMDVDSQTVKETLEKNVDLPGGGTTTTDIMAIQSIGLEAGNYEVILTVTSTEIPQGKTLASMGVEVNVSAHPPTAVIGGPYVAMIGETVEVDGTSSYDVDEGLSESGSPPFDGITAYDWNSRMDEPYDFNDAHGARASLPPYDNAGVHEIALRVTDNTAAAFPGAGTGNLNHIAYGDVTVFQQGVTTLDIIPESHRCKLLWNDIGAYPYEILRSSKSANEGFEKIGTTSDTFYRDRTVSKGKDYWYRIGGEVGGRETISPAVHVDIR